MNDDQREYTGTVHPQPGELDDKGQRLYPYLPSQGLIEAVKLTRYLKRPLLLKGEPGCGKTQLARAVAYELGLPFEPWYIKSTSRARDGLYTYDAIGRLRDAHLATAGQSVAPKTEADYVRWGPLGRAFQNKKRTVVLIDEIDKADIDFPNDLLLELDEQRFKVEETDRWIKARFEPIVFITSNDEKDLPDAFLRRCLFYYVEFPRDTDLIKIVSTRFPDTPEPLVQAAVERFYALRKEMDKGDVGKKPSTSELIDWVDYLRSSPDEAFKKLKGQLPYPSVLLKSWDSHRKYLTQATSTTKP